MNLKNKAIIAVTAIVVVACVLMGFIGYIRVEDAFAKALQMKAESDVQSMAEILDYRYEGHWNLRDGKLYKGDKLMENADDVIESLSRISKGKVTIFIILFLGHRPLFCCLQGHFPPLIKNA